MCVCGVCVLDLSVYYACVILDLWVCIWFFCVVLDEGIYVVFGGREVVFGSIFFF